VYHRPDRISAFFCIVWFGSAFGGGILRRKTFFLLAFVEGWEMHLGRGEIENWVGWGGGKYRMVE